VSQNELAVLLPNCGNFDRVQLAVGHRRHPRRLGVRVGDRQIVLRIERHRMVAFVNFNLTHR
jgi:hypothetical protein